jgi:putative aminopeptidase FrvX
MENFVDMKLLTDLLSVPSVTYDEWEMVDFLANYFDTKGYQYDIDEMGNLFLEKGDAINKPLICAHIDTVHSKKNINIREEMLPRENCFGQKYDNTKLLCLKGYDDNGNETGCGGDDKCGIYTCLEIFDRVENVKMALFVSEEIGCIGSRNCDGDFFKDLTCAISFDGPGNQLVSEVSNGVKLFDRSSLFFQIVDSTLNEMDYKPLYQSHPYTDIYMIKNRFGIDCINFSCGYYNMHRDSEYVCIDDINKAIDTGLRLIENLSY